MFHRFTQTVKAFFNYIISDIFIAWAFITLQRIESIFQFIYLSSFGFHNKIWFAYKVFKWGRSIWNFTFQAFPYISKERINSCAMFVSPNKSTLLTVIFRGIFDDFNVILPISFFIFADTFLNYI